MSLHEENAGFYFVPGDTKAYTELFNRFYQPLIFFASRLLRDRGSAEDIVSEIFLKLWAKKMRFETFAKVKAWLYISTRNACFNYIKHPNNQRKEHLQNDTDFVYDEIVLKEIIKAEVFREVIEMIEFLPQECRKIVKLSFFDGRDNHEIANMLCLSVHTVKNQKARAIYLIRKRRSGNLR